MDYLEKYHDDMVKELQNFVKIKSVEDYATASENRPFGNGPGEVLEYALSLCERLGMKTTNLNGYVGYAEVGSGNEMIALLCHLDVVPEGDLLQWEYPPYSATKVDGKILGRGASDNKSPAIASIYSLKSLMDAGFDFTKRVRLIFGVNEESGFECMKYYVKHAELPTMGFTPDGAFPIIHGEKGIIQFTFSCNVIESDEYKILSLYGGNAANNVADKCVCEIELPDSGKFAAKVTQCIQDKGFQGNAEVSGSVVTITVNGKSAHGSTPEDGINAISRMFEILSLCGINSHVIEGYNQKIGYYLNGEKLKIDLCDQFGKLTMNVGKVLLEKGKVMFTIDVRYPITKSVDDFYPTLQKQLSEVDFMVEINLNKDPIYYDLDHPLIKALLGAYRDISKDTVSQPITMGGGTYARAMPNLVAFGGTYPNRVMNPHKPNEFVLIEDLLSQAYVYIEAMKRLILL